VPGWRAVPLAEIGTDRGPDWWAPWARDAGYGVRWHQIREHLGITGFGVNAYWADAGEELVVPHDEEPYGGQEELYVVVRGAARFTCDGEDVELGETDLLYVPSEVTREARALRTPTLLLMIGGNPGAYEEYDWDAWQTRQDLADGG
jgi:mannose-6-phosphate isomerase-like protein (cupin superfamily)